MKPAGMCRRVVAAALVAALVASTWRLAAEAASATGCRLWGQVTTSDGAPLPGVAVRFSNGLPPQVTDRLGCYETLAQAEGEQCLVTPSKPGYRFLPTQRSVWLSGQAAEASFVADAARAKRRFLDTPALMNGAALAVTTLAINNDATLTTIRDVTLNNTCAGSPTHYQASELPTFTGATWLPYSAAPAFTLSAGNDTKTVYMRVATTTELSTATADTIVLNQPTLVELLVNGPVKTAHAWPEAEEDWFFFTVATTAAHTIETWAGTLVDNYLELYAADQTTLLTADDDSGEGACAKIVRTLDPGTYFVKGRARDATATGTYAIRVTTGDTTITVLDPHGDPAANTFLEVGNAEVVFSSTSPGILEVTCRFAVNPGTVTGIQDKVRACIEPVGASLLRWESLLGTPSTWSGSAAGRPATAHTTMGKAVYNATTSRYEVKAIFTGLPPNNADFGPKRLWAQIVDGAAVAATADQPIEVFFPKTATNNPGTGRNAGPNWFYYWKTGNVCGTTAGWEYATSPDYGFYMPGEDHVNVCDAAPNANSGPEYYENDLGDGITVAGQGLGPQCCTETIAHEVLHKWIYETWAPLIAAAEADGEDDGDDYDDPDDDGIPNIFEATYLGIATDTNDPDTYNMGTPYTTYGDQEVRCRKTELDPGLTSAPEADWAYPGNNSYPRYPQEAAAQPQDNGGTQTTTTPGSPLNDHIVQRGTDAADVQAAAGGPGNDTIVQYGGAGNDTQSASGHSGHDTIIQYGGAGDDLQIASGGGRHDHIKQFGGPGNDTSQASGGRDRDTISQYGRQGNDSLVADGGTGNDAIVQDGGDGNDTQLASGGDDNDRITQRAGTGNDTAIVAGGAGNDRIYQHGEEGHDTLAADGGDGDDFIWQHGGTGRDSLIANGGNGNDTIVMLGSHGNDTLTYELSPGADRAYLLGGGGTDTATIRANSQSFTLVSLWSGATLYQQGTGGTRIVAASIENLTVIGNDGTTAVYTGSAR